MARRRNQRTPAQARRERAHLLKEIAREHKRADRRRLEDLLAKLRAARAERRRAIAGARASCKTRGRLPTLKQLALELRTAKAKARGACVAELAQARRLKGDEARARAEHRAEQKQQRELRRIERGNRAQLRAARARPGLAKVRRGESDDEVRGNIPPELVYMFERVKRQIKGSERMTRTEAFLKYAEEHPDEEIAALEDKTEAMIREHEARMRRSNPKKKKPKKSKRRARAREPKMGAACDMKKALRRERQRTRALRAELKAKKRRNPSRPPARWFDQCLASVSARHYARDPAAVCGAAWWRLPVARRRSIVRRLERGSPRDRRFAVGIAKAEQRRHDKARGKHEGPPRRRRNPGGSVPLVALAYEEQKEGDRKPHVYEHVFEGRRPRVVMRGGKLALVGGSQFTKEGWIHG